MLTEIPQLSWFFLLIFTLNGLTVILILILKNNIIRSTQLLLAINLLGITFGSIIICLIETKFILKAPFLFRLPSPVYYLMFPAAYLYVKLIVRDCVNLKKSEYLHFIPAVVHLIEMTPFYLKSNAEKIAIINNIYSYDINIYAHNEGWLPPFYHNIIRGIMAIVYSFAMWQLLQKSQSKMNFSNKINFSKTLQWLKVFTVMNGMLGFIVIETMTFTFIPSEIRSLSLHVTFISILIISNYYLLFHPEILYGMPRLAQGELSGLENKKIAIKKINISTTFSNTAANTDTNKEKIVAPSLDEFKIQVNNYIFQSKVYLNPDLSIIDLSRATNIPVHHLRLLINKSEGLRFNDFINQYRIEHMQALINNQALLNKTLETLAFDSGFSSKPAFIRGIKKLTNQTPGVYFKQRKAKSNLEIL